MDARSLYTHDRINRCTSISSPLLRHYYEFNGTMQANSATGVLEGRKEQKEPLPHNIPTIRKINTIPTESADSPDRTGQSQPLIAIIPAYNEELVIGTVVLETGKHVDQVIVVDDGSTDRTAEVAALAGAEVISLEKNRGKAQAMMAGFARVRETGCEALVMLDGDGQHNPDEIPDLLVPVLDGSADLVIGSRFLMEGNNIPRYRQLGQKTLDLATQATSGYKCSDSQSGFRAISCKGLKHLDFKSEGYNIESDMITHFLADGLRITEVPITVRYEVPNKHKKHPVSHGFDILGHLIGIVGYKRPLLSFGLPGGILVLIGLVVGSYAFAEYYATTRFQFTLTMLSALFLIMGLLLVTTAFILNSLVQIVKMEK
jgi:Glycosyltransferases involved in cell wall biogenesis